MDEKILSKFKDILKLNILIEVTGDIDGRIYLVELNTSELPERLIAEGREEKVKEVKERLKKEFPTHLLEVSKNKHKRSDFELSNALLDFYLSRYPNLPPEEQSDLLLWKGVDFCNLKDWRNAEECFRDSLRYNPKNHFTKHKLAWFLYKRKGQVHEALKLLNEIIEENGNDIIAYETELEILTDIDEIEEAEEVYKIVEKLLNDDPSSLWAEFACVRYLSRRGEILRERGEGKEADVTFKNVLERYENLIKRVHEIIEEEEKQKISEVIIRNSFGCFYIDTLGNRKDGVSQLEKASEVYFENVNSNIKIISLYLNEKEGLEKKENEIKERVYKIFKFFPDCHPAQRSLLILERKLRRWINIIIENEFWKEIYRIDREYEKILEPEDDYLNLDNAITLFDRACFIASAEAEAHKRGFLKAKPKNLPPADELYRKSIDAVEKYIGDKERIGKDVRKHLALACWFLGTYLITVGGLRDINKFEEGLLFIEKSTNLDKKAEFEISSLNAFVEAWVGILQKKDGKEEKAKKRYENSIKLLSKKWQTLWKLGRFFESRGLFDLAYKCFFMAANGQSLAILFSQLRSIVEDWRKSQKCSTIIALQRKLECSKRAYRLDPDNLRNISDYTHDLYGLGKEAKDKEILKEAERQFNFLYEKYNEAGNREEEGWNLWYINECREKIKGRVDEKIIRDYIEATILNVSRLHKKLRDKIVSCDFSLLNNDLILRIEILASLHPEYTSLNEIASLTLWENRQYKRALSYLEKTKHKDIYALQKHYLKSGDGMDYCTEYYKLVRKEKFNLSYKYLAFLYNYDCFVPESLLAKFIKRIDENKFGSVNSKNLFIETLNAINWEDIEHRKFITRLVSSISDKRDEIKLKEVKKIITKMGVTYFMLRHATILEIKRWKEICSTFWLEKDAKSCVERILTLESKNLTDKHIKITEMKKMGLKENALSILKEEMQKSSDSSFFNRYLAFLGEE